MFKCQSIIGALACAPGDTRYGREPFVVSVDHWRARLRALTYSFDSFKFICVSRSLARSPARRVPLVVMVNVPSCQSIIGALACAPWVSSYFFLKNLRVSRSLARSPARRRSCTRLGN